MGECMSKIKKLVLSLSVALTMAIAFIVGVIGLNANKPQNSSVVEKCSRPSVTETKPATYTYAPNQVQIVKGSDQIRYEYQPDVLSNETTVTAYEYMFGSILDETMAVNLKYINTTDVNVSYAYSSTPLDTTQSITGETTFNTQTITENGGKIYIYVLVSPTNENIPATFTQDIVWWFGKLGTMTITNPATNQTITKQAVAGQEIDEEYIKSTFNISDDCYFSYFYDREYTEYATNIVQNRPVYIDVGNLPTSYLAWDSTSSSYYVKQGSSTLPENLIIPATYNDGTNGLANVTYIHGTSSSDGAFYNRRGTLKSVELPSTITTIGSYAFYFCQRLTSADLSRCTSLTTIGSNTFQYCGELTSIDLSKCTSLTSMGNYIFNSCSGLTSITLPSSLTSIGDGLLSNCSRVESIVVDTGNTVYDSRNNCNALIETSTNILIQGCNNTIIPSDITSIGSLAFSTCSGLTSITLPSSLTSIEERAFNSCSGLTSITLPSSLTSIGSSAFYNCSALAEVYNLSTNITINVGDSGNGYVGYYAKVIHTSLDEPSRIQTIDNVQYYVYGTDFIALGPTSKDITSITLDSRTTQINQYAFQNCRELTSVDLNQCTSLTSIGASAFQFCSGLTSITLPSSLISIGNGAFSGCSRLTGDLIIPNGATSIGSQSFYDCAGLTSIVIPSTVTSINSSAFQNCSGLTSIVIEEGNTVYDSRNNCNAIIETSTNTLIQGCKNTVIPNNITSIGSSAFYNCSGLTSIDLSGCTSLTSIGYGAFQYCKGLTSIVIPANVTKIGAYAFRNCTNLTSITFEDTSTWYYGTSSNQSSMSGGTEIDVIDASANATYFKSTYYNKYWYKV